MFFKLMQSAMKRFISDETFMFNTVRLHYFYHSYNTVDKERTIEVPIIRYYLDVFKPKNSLEIGNVTKHYYDLFRDVKRDVVDRDEKAYDVFNVDICDFNPKHQYRFIFSISTFEHMGDTMFRNIHHVVYDLLREHGVFVLTFPIGEKKDRVSMSTLRLFLNHFYCTNICYFFRRRSGLRWTQITEGDIKEDDICVWEIRR